MPPKFKSGKPMQSGQQYRDEARSDSTQSFKQLSLMEECDCPGECNNENHLAEFSSFKQHDPHESRTSPKFKKANQCSPETTDSRILHSCH
ncbi:hypothetical protein CEXT_515701 [Caerostris extrusa]|uniref:Uncharacterized protein n=1 Tax=Caerostris extrusa TaxID=172846 RepID=A0AAV4MKZ8_CAEEX|nr:hypothetical protein CEXT_515701 [Caerostris extrusa]